MSWYVADAETVPAPRLDLDEALEAGIPSLALTLSRRRNLLPHFIISGGPELRTRARRRSKESATLSKHVLFTFDENLFFLQIFISFIIRSDAVSRSDAFKTISEEENSKGRRSRSFGWICVNNVIYFQNNINQTKIPMIWLAFPPCWHWRELTNFSFRLS